MKTYEQLTPEQQAKARSQHVNHLLEAIIEGGLRFNDELNQDDLQARIDAAWAAAEKMQTPWFVSEYIMDTCRVEIEGMALCNAEDALYAEDDDPIVCPEHPEEHSNTCPTCSEWRLE